MTQYFPSIDCPTRSNGNDHSVQSHIKLFNIIASCREVEYKNGTWLNVINWDTLGQIRYQHITVPYVNNYVVVLLSCFNIVTFCVRFCFYYIRIQQKHTRKNAGELRNT